MSRGRARDHELLDALDALPRETLRTTVWRVVRSDRDPLLCRSSCGRWDLGHFDVLYTSLDPDGAISEIYFHLSRQPVFPSTVEFTHNEVVVTARTALRFEDVRQLEPLGVNPDKYSGILYERTQEIGDAAAFLGCDGLIAPSARWDCLNLIVFCDNVAPDDLMLKGSSVVDWDVWRDKTARI